ncbi:MAG: histidine phosphatase family protein [Acidimicrobiales bacterium]
MPDELEPGQIVLVRHGETEWSASGQHTSRTDLPLLEHGRRDAEALGPMLAKFNFAMVLSSPMRRALDTCTLAGLGDRVEVDTDLMEWDYGDYEGITTPDIRTTVPGWRVWTHPTPNAETADEVAARADKVLDRCRPIVDRGDDVALFGHGHMSRVIAARWLKLPATDGRQFALHAGSLSVLGHERETPVIERWNHWPGAI